MPTNFMYRLLSANEKMILLRDVQTDLVFNRMLNAYDNEAQLKLDREQAEIDARLAEVQDEFIELAEIAALN